MIAETVTQLNWIDFLILIILFRIGYVAIRSNIAVELFKLAGTVLAIYLAFHYYTVLSDFIRHRIHIGKKMPVDFFDFVCFLFLVGVGYMAFVGLREVFCRVVKMDAIPTLNRWGAFVIGLSRGVLVCGLVIFMFVISTISFLKNSTVKSYSGKYLYGIGPSVYSSIWEGLMSKFMTEEKLNKTVFENEPGPLKK